MRRILRSPLWLALLIALADWVVQFSDPAAHIYWNSVYKYCWQRPAPQSIVVVNAEDINETGAVGEAQLIDLVRKTNPRRLYVDLKLQFNQTATADARLRLALERLGDNTAFVLRPTNGSQFEDNTYTLPSTNLIHNHRVVVSSWTENFLWFPESAPYSVQINTVSYPTFGADLGGRTAGWSANYYPDFSIDPATIPQLSGKALLDGQASPALLTGKTVILTSAGAGATRGYFGHGVVNPVAFEIAGAAAVAQPVNFSLTREFLLAVVFALVVWGHRLRRRRSKAAVYLGAVLALTVLPVLLRMLGLVAYPNVGMVFLLIYGGIRFWQKRTQRIQHTSASGLPNMLALSAGTLPVGRDVVVAAIARFEEIMATLPRDLHGECAQQIARRIAVGCGSEDIYHSDGGHFAWTEEARPLDMQLSHLEGLRALFAAPLQIGPHTFDINIHFGLDRNEGIEPATRVNSALASSNEALANGRAIELFEAHRLAEAPWELSLHTRIDEGLRSGDIWLAFQSQWDIATGRICGAEALIRWNHPTRGPIAPNAFILQAERAGRIDALTYWVLDQAISAALAMNGRGERFQMSVNLSAQMVDKPDLVKNFGDMVARRRIDPGLITVEVTETSSVGNRPAAVHNLGRLREMGFRLSIDDFGTGEASLAYLADMPSDELKLDRRFVSRIVDCPRERAIVASTIGLAHALGQTVVAEGIEDAATLALLRDLHCDLAQGYYLGRPQPFAVFEQEYEASRHRQFGQV